MGLSENEYLNRIAKCEERIIKIQKRIEKWEAKKDKNAYIKDIAPWFSKEPKKIKSYDDLIQAKYDYENIYGIGLNLERCKNYLDDNYDSWLKNCEKEIKYAKRDLEDIKVTLDSYKNKLAIVSEKNSKPVIKIFKEFFDKWKNDIKEYVKPLSERLYEINYELCNMHNSRNSLIGDGKQYATKEVYDNAYNELKKEERELNNIKIVKIAHEKGYGSKNRSSLEFEKYLDDYMNDRYDELVNKVTKITGEITDVNNLYIGYDGTLNGIIVGEDGKAKIETIIAGGYAIQCLHYRCLVHSVR